MEKIVSIVVVGVAVVVVVAAVVAAVVAVGGGGGPLRDKDRFRLQCSAINDRLSSSLIIVSNTEMFN